MKLLGKVQAWLKPFIYLTSVFGLIIIGVFLLNQLLPHLREIGWTGVLTFYLLVVTLVYWVVQMGALFLDVYRSLWRK